MKPSLPMVLSFSSRFNFVIIFKFCGVPAIMAPDLVILSGTSIFLPSKPYNPFISSSLAAIMVAEFPEITI